MSEIERRMQHGSARGSDVEQGKGLLITEENENGSRSSISSATERYSKKTNNNPFSNFSKLIFCFAGLQVSYILWGVVQEHLMTHEYTLGKFRSSAFLVFANRFLALLISLVIVVTQRFMNPNKAVKNVPFYYYAPASLSNTISSWAQYEALKYVSFPTQVLSKSCKIIPVMLVS